MAQQEVKIVFKIDGIDEEITDLNQLNNALKNTKTETEKLGDAKKQTEGRMDKFGNKLSSLPGPLGAVGQGVKGLNMAFKALLANPIMLAITAIVAAITTLGKVFFSTKEGGEALERFMAGFSAVFDVLRDAVLPLTDNIKKLFTDPKQALIDFGESIKTNLVNRFNGMLELIPALGTSIKLFFEGEFSQAAETAGNAVGKAFLGVEDVVGKVGDVVGEAVDEANRAAELTGTLQKLKDEQRDLNVLRAEQNALIAEAKLKVDDETLSISERQTALKEASKLEQELLDEELRIENERLAALEELAEMSDSDAETLDQIAEQRIKIANLNEQSTNKQRQLTRGLQQLENEAAADKKANDEEKIRLSKEYEAQLKAEVDALEKYVDDNFLALDEDLKNWRNYYDGRLQQEQEFNEQYDAFIEARIDNDAKDEANKKRLQALEARRDQMIMDSKYALAEASVKAAEFSAKMIERFGKDEEKSAKAAFVVNKIASIADVIINYQKAKVGILASASTLPPGAREVYLTKQLASARITSGISLATILATKFNGGNSNLGGDGGGGGGSAPSINYSFGQAGGPTIEPGQLTTGEEAQPIQTYVLASDVSNAQQAQQQIQNLSQL